MISDTPETPPVRPRFAGSAKGFTLVEALVSVALLGFVAMGVMGLLSTVIRQNKLAKERSTATALASERLNEITAQPFRASVDYLRYKLPEESATPGPPATLTTDYGQLPGFPDFRRVVTLTYDVPVAGMLRVQTEVFWQNRQQGVKSHEMVTYLHPALEQAP